MVIINGVSPIINKIKHTQNRVSFFNINTSFIVFPFLRTIHITLMKYTFNRGSTGPVKKV